MKKLVIPVLVVVLSAGLLADRADGAAKDAPAVKLPPGWSASWAGTLTCPRCLGLGYPENVGKCQVCGRGTASGAFRLCPKHALEQKRCSRCFAGFPKPPVTGVQLRISWVDPKLNIKDAHMEVDSAKSIPIWVSLVNTTDKPLSAPGLQARGPNPHLCETLLFVVRSGKKEKVFFNVSPWVKRRRSLAPRPLTLKPGVTAFQRDLATRHSALGKLGPGRHTVIAAAGWLQSNTLTLTIGGGAITVPPVDRTDPKAGKRLAELRKSWEMNVKLGRYAQAAEIARRIAQIHPDLGRKMLMMSEVYLKKQHAKSDADRKRELEEKVRREQMLKDEELKRRREMGN